MPPNPPPPTLVLLSSRPNCVMLPITMASTPRMRPNFAAVFESARSLFEKFCSARTLSSALRSMTLYTPPFTNLSTSKSAIPLPTSWLVPKMDATLLWTVPYSKFRIAMRCFVWANSPAVKLRNRTLKQPSLFIGFPLLLMCEHSTLRVSLATHKATLQGYNALLGKGTGQLGEMQNRAAYGVRRTACGVRRAGDDAKSEDVRVCVVSCRVRACGVPTARVTQNSKMFDC